MSWQDYLAALYGGQTGTDDPSSAGFSFPSLIGSAQAAEAPIPPMPGQAMPAQPASSPAAPGGFAEPLGMKFLRAMRDPGSMMMNGIAGPPPASAAPAPPIPGPFPQQAQDPAAQAPMPPQAPGPVPQRGGARILAQLYNPEPIQAPGGGSMADAGVSMLGPPPPGSPYAMLQGAARGAQMTGQPAPPPIPPPFQQQPQAAPQAAPTAAPRQLGGRTMAWADKVGNSPLTNYSPLKVDKPTIWDNLTRFGLAAMAAGGKPMATTLGALGEAGLSTVDQNRKQEQSNVENELKNRQVGIQGQGILAKAYELVDSLQQRSQDRALSVAAQQQTAHDAQSLRAAIATGNQSLIQQKIDEATRHNQEMELTRQQGADDRTERTQQRLEDQRRLTQRDADQTYAKSYSEIGKDMNSVGLSLDQKQFRARQEAAMAHPESTHANIYQQKTQQLRAQAQAAIAAGKPKAGVNKMLQDYGLDPLP